MVLQVREEEGGEGVRGIEGMGFGRRNFFRGGVIMDREDWRQVGDR